MFNRIVNEDLVGVVGFVVTFVFWVFVAAVMAFLGVS